MQHHSMSYVNALQKKQQQLHDASNMYSKSCIKLDTMQSMPCGKGAPGCLQLLGSAEECCWQHPTQSLEMLSPAHLYPLPNPVRQETKL